MKWLSRQGHARAMWEPDLLDRLQPLLDMPGTPAWRQAVYEHICDLGTFHLMEYPDNRDKVAGWFAEWCESDGGIWPWLNKAFFHKVVDPDEAGSIKDCLRRAFDVAPDGMGALYVVRRRLDFAIEYEDLAFLAETIDAMGAIADNSSPTGWHIASEVLDKLPPEFLSSDLRDQLRAELKRIRGGRRLSS